MTTPPVARWRSTSAIWQTSSARSICDEAVADGKVGLERPRRRLVLDDADHARRHPGWRRPVRGCRSRRREPLAQPDGVRALSPDSRRAECRPPAARRRPAARRARRPRRWSSVGRSETMRKSARRPGAIEPSSRSRPKCWAVLMVAIWIAVTGLRPCAMAWRTTRSMWPSCDQRAGMAVVGAQDEVARIEAPFGHRLDLRGDVVPGRAQPQHRLHALAHARRSASSSRVPS